MSQTVFCGGKQVLPFIGYFEKVFFFFVIGTFTS